MFPPRGFARGDCFVWDSHGAASPHLRMTVTTATAPQDGGENGYRASE